MRNPRLLATLAVPALAVGLSACQAKDNTDAGNAGGDQKIQVVSTDDACDVSSEGAPRATCSSRSRTRAARSPSSTSTARTASASSARWRTSAPACPATWSCARPPGKYVDRPAGPACRATASGRTSGQRLGRGRRHRGRRPGRHRRGDPPVRPLRRGPGRPARRQDEAVRRRLRRRQRRRGPAALPARALPLGGHRDRRGVVRRPRPQDRPARGRPRARPEVDRLAPAREGPLAAEGLHPDDRRRAQDLRRRPDGEHPDPRHPGGGPDLHRRPDRQRLQGPARRGRHRQDHRRGGHLVAHRPVGLPGQRRRRPGRLRDPKPLLEVKDPALSKAIAHRFAALQKLSTSYRVRATVSSSTTRSTRPSASSSPTRSTRSPSRCRR